MYIYFQFSCMVQRPVDVNQSIECKNRFLLISGVNCEYNVSITASMCPITRYAAELNAYQRPKSSNHVVSSCLAILQELTWNWTIIVFFILVLE